MCCVISRLGGCMGCDRGPGAGGNEGGGKWKRGNALHGKGLDSDQPVPSLANQGAPTDWPHASHESY